METLPYEMVLKIGQQLSPEDLAHCCGVSRGWREVFNQDWLWKLHCDPALEEHLRTTPAIVEPVFVIPGCEGSTLEPLCQWKLAFLRENHLRNNWKHNYHRTGILNEVKNEVYREFLSDTLVVRWFMKYFAVWDVSVDPAVFVAKTDPTEVDVANWIDCYVTNGLLVVEQFGSVKVFFVDTVNKSIQLKHDISLDDVKSAPADSEYVQQLKSSITRLNRKVKSGIGCVKANYFIHVNVNRSKLDVFDLETGVKIKEHNCTSLRSSGKRFEVMRLSTSPTSDYVLVACKMKPEEITFKDYYVYFVYNPQKLSFILGFYAISKTRALLVLGIGEVGSGEVHSHYLAIGDMNVVTVYDCHADKTDVLLRSDLLQIGFYNPGSSNKFLCEGIGPAIFIKMFDLSSRTWSTIEGPLTASGSATARPRFSRHSFKVFNNKLLAFSDPEFGWYLLLKNVWVKCDIPFEDDSIINRAFSKVISQDSGCFDPRDTDRQQEWYIYHYW